jgi:hypothetical protein
MQHTFQAWREQTQLRRLELRLHENKSQQCALKPWLLPSDSSFLTLSPQAATQHSSVPLSNGPSFSSLDDEVCKDRNRREHCDGAENRTQSHLSASNAAEVLSKAEAHIGTLEARVCSSAPLLIAPHGACWNGFCSISYDEVVRLR